MTFSHFWLLWDHKIPFLSSLAEKYVLTTDSMEKKEVVFIPTLWDSFFPFFFLQKLVFWTCHVLLLRWWYFIFAFQLNFYWVPFSYKSFEHRIKLKIYFFYNILFRNITENGNCHDSKWSSFDLRMSFFYWIIHY